MTLILDENYLTINNNGKKFKNLSFGTLKRDYSGFVQMTSWNDDFLESYQFQNGKIIGYGLPKGISNKNGRRGCTLDVQEIWKCVGAENPCCTVAEYSYDPGSVCCGQFYMTCHYEYYYNYYCVPDDVSEPVGSNNNNDFSQMYRDVTKNITNPCMSDAYDKILNSLPSLIQKVSQNFAKKKKISTLRYPTEILAKISTI